MFEMNVPYDKGTMKISLPEKNLAGVLEGKQSEYTTELSEKELVEQSLDNPIGSKSLEELAKGKKDIVIISSDHTRPVPSKIITKNPFRISGCPNPHSCCNWFSSSKYT